jgi:hypothetical protein
MPATRSMRSASVVARPAFESRQNGGVGFSGTRKVDKISAPVDARGRSTVLVHRRMAAV